MKRRSFSSLFADFSLPDEFLSMDLYSACSLQAEVAGKPFGREIFDFLNSRACFIRSIFGESSSSELARRFGISLEWMEHDDSHGNLRIFSLLVPEKRKIILYPSTLQDLFLFLRKFLNADLKFEAVAENALFHELCHYADFCYAGGFTAVAESYSEITADIFLDGRNFLGIYPWFADVLFKGSLMRLI